MAKFLITYSGGQGPDDMTAEQRDQVMKAWNDWYGSLGDAVVDFGNPTGASKKVVPGGVVSDVAPVVTGYSLIGADSLDDAADKCRNHPHLEAGGTVTIHETFDVM